MDLLGDEWLDQDTSADTSQYDVWFRQDMVLRNRAQASFAHTFAMIYPFFVHDRRLLQWYDPSDDPPQYTNHSYVTLAETLLDARDVDISLRVVLMYLKTLNLASLSISHAQSTAITRVIAHLNEWLDQFLVNGSSPDYVLHVA